MCIHLISPTLTLAALFTAAPIEVLPLLDKTMRLDLMDLYEAHMEARIGNRFGGETEMTMLSDTLIALRMTQVSTFEMRLLEDSTIEVKHSYSLPKHVGTSVQRYSTDWTIIN